MTRFGVGPLWVGITAALPGLMLWLTHFDPSAWRIPWLPAALRVGLGWALVALGVPLFVWSLVILERGFPKGELFTRGPYSLCRHPIYGSWCALIVPGIVLLVDRWPGFVGIALLWLSLRLLARREVRWLEQTFGDAYRAYHAKTPALLPFPWLFRP